MVLNLSLLYAPTCSFPCMAHRNLVPEGFTSARMAKKAKIFASIQASDPMVDRRSANYLPSILDSESVNSLASNFTGERHASRRDKLIEKVRDSLEEVEEPLAHLELTDDLHRLGVGYIFEKEINYAIDNMSNTNNGKHAEDLYCAALRFRLLRKHGHEVSQDIFNSFMDERGSFKASLCEDPKGLLSLYEASYLGLEGETTLDEARDFATRNLKYLKGTVSPDLSKMVNRSLELPLHWRINRLEARWYMDVYERKHNMNPILFELAKLDYNMVQAIYQEDVKAGMRWWKGSGLGGKLSFSRDRLTECFIWALGINWHPQFSWCRNHLTKAIQLVTTIDDVYDIYGSLNELELFTNVVDRWDVNGIEELPEYMKLCFLTLYNTVNEIGYEILNLQGWNVIPHLKKGWADLCKAYLVEAKWYLKGYKPSLDEYLSNGWASISGPTILGHAYMCVTQEITREALDCLDNGSDLVYCSSMVLRLTDDMGTSTDEMERGDVPKAIQCYMYEAGVSEQVAREHVKNLIGDTWKKMNKEILSSSPFPQALKDCAANLARISHCFYQYGDSFGAPSHETMDRANLLLVEPIPLSEK